MSRELHGAGGQPTHDPAGAGAGPELPSGLALGAVFDFALDGAGGDEQALVVIDVDNKNGKDGDAQLLALELQGYELPQSLEQSTPSGGRHIITDNVLKNFTTNATNAAINNADEIILINDTLGDPLAPMPGQAPEVPAAPANDGQQPPDGASLPHYPFQDPDRDRCLKFRVSRGHIDELCQVLLGEDRCCQYHG